MFKVPQNKPTEPKITRRKQKRIINDFYYLWFTLFMAKLGWVVECIVWGVPGVTKIMKIKLLPSRTAHSWRKVRGYGYSNVRKSASFLWAPRRGWRNGSWWRWLGLNWRTGKISVARKVERIALSRAVRLGPDKKVIGLAEALGKANGESSTPTSVKWGEWSSSQMYRVPGACE